MVNFKHCLRQQHNPGIMTIFLIGLFFYIAILYVLVFQGSCSQTFTKFLLHSREVVKFSGGQLISHRGLKLNSKISAGEYEKN